MNRIKLEARCVLLDIEGTVSDVRFVYDVMFPYAKENMESFLRENWSKEEVQQAITIVAHDAQHASVEEWLGMDWRAGSTSASSRLVSHLQSLMASDSKSTGLKQLQGLVWKSGFENGALRAELFDDVLPALKEWRSQGIDLRIYSSGSVLAQKLFFRYTTQGDMSGFFSGHYDTLLGGKKECASYQRIADEIGLAPSEILFITDVYAELAAATQAGMQVVASVRPNNVALPADFTGLTITSFSELEIRANRSLV